MIATWKRQAIDGLTGIFSGKPQDSRRLRILQISFLLVEISMGWLSGLLIGIVAFCVVGPTIWRHRQRDFRAAVIIENLRLWREQMEAYRVRHPDETYSFDVSMEAVYMAMNNKYKKAMMLRAWDRVKAMKKFRVQECEAGRNIGPLQVIYANTEIEAAKAVAIGCTLRPAGKLGELRVRVREVDMNPHEVCFYSDANEGLRA